MSKNDALIRLRTHLSDLFDARFGGADGARYARVQGLADGYMQALEDMGLADARELLAVVRDERHAAAARADIGMASLPPPGPVMPHFA
jgi:hypothetical protein